jgi:hypothetical protein
VTSYIALCLLVAAALLLVLYLLGPSLPGNLHAFRGALGMRSS